MANSVSSHNEMTLMKVLKALTANDAMTMDEGFAAIERMSNAGILFREPAEKEEKAKPTKNDKDTTSVPE